MDFIRNIVALFLTMFSVSVAVYHVNFTLKEDSAMEGGDFLATCCVDNEDDQKVFFVIWAKLLDDGSQHEVEIATNSHVNEAFQKTGRYNASLQLVEAANYGKVKFFLAISNVQSEDSGQYKCRVSLNEKKEKEIYRPFKVFVPVQKVWWSSVDPVTQKEIIYGMNENIQLKEGDVRKFACHIDGGYPKPPKVQILLGNQDISSSMNFNISSELKKRDGQRGLQPLYYKTEAFNNDLNITYAFHDQKLRCIGKIPETGIEKSANLNITLSEYAPQFQCSKKVFAKLHEQNYNLSCIVHASPEVKFLKFLWASTDGDNDTTIENSNEYSPDTQVNGNEVSMVLTIFRVSSKHFRKYLFEAQNDIRRVRHEIDLVQDTHHNTQIGMGYSDASRLLAAVILNAVLMAIFFI